VVDLGRVYEIVGVGYSLDWDGAFRDPLTFEAQVSVDGSMWTPVSHAVHACSPVACCNQLSVDVVIRRVQARHVKGWEPPDGEWNGWGDLFQLRAFTQAAE
jgi:hypothetical protein